MGEGIPEDLAKIGAISENFLKHLPAGFDIAMLTQNSKIPFKILSYREALFHRFSDAFSSAHTCALAGRPISTALLTRSTMETLARMQELNKKVSRFIENNDSSLLDEFMDNRVFGSRNNPDLPKAASILGSIDSMSEIIPNFRNVYDILSEYCHPNYSGTFGSFAKID